MKSIAGVLKRLRKEADMSQKSIAKKLGVSFCTVNRWENNHNEASNLAKIRIKALSIQLHKDGKVSYRTFAETQNILNKYVEVQ